MNQTVKVLQVFGSLNMGGAESRMMDVYRVIDRNECHFDFLTMTEDAQYFENEIQTLGGRIIRVPSPRDCGVRKHFQQLRRCMRDGAYDAVHAHTSYHCGLVMAAAWMEHIPVRISHARTSGSKQTGKLKSLFLRIGSILTNAFSTHRLAISNDAGHFLFGNKAFEVLPNAINIDNYQKVDATKVRTTAQQLGIDAASFVIGQIGRFESMKNQSFTLQWFSRFLKKNPTAQFVFIGDGTLRPEIEKQAGELGVKNNVVFTGIRSDVNIILHAFDLVMVPSIYEGFSGVILEAQAAGVPCVVSDSIPMEADLGLGLISRCKLSEGYEVWEDAADRSRTLVRPSQCEIISAFDRRGFSLSSVTERFLEMYRGK